MTYRPRCFCAAILAGALAAGSASAQVLFQDNFDSHPDGDTASVWQGGTPNDPGGGDADPVATIGSWGPIFEVNPWYIQVSTATNGPTAGPAPGSTKYLTLYRPDGGVVDARGTLASPATGLLSIDFLAQSENGPVQFFVRNAAGGGFSGLPAYLDLTSSGTVSMNGALTSLTYDPTSYASVHLLIDLPAQRWSATINGNSAANATNRPFAEPVTSIEQISFYAADLGTFGVDNVLVQAVPEPATALLGLIAGAGLMVRRTRRRLHC